MNKTLEQIKKETLDEIASKMMHHNGHAFKNWEEYAKWERMGNNKFLIEMSVDVYIRNLERKLKLPEIPPQTKARGFLSVN